jgi:toxin-antitoxin system PIN domain toxin
MIVIDANILIYAYDTGVSHHRAAREYLEKVFSASYPVGIPVQCVSAFLRVTTQRSLRGAQFSMPEAVEIVEEWLSLPHVRLLIPGDHHWPIFRRMLLEGQSSGRLVTDALIAATAMEYGGELQTNDRDFARFPGLRWKNPLAKH